MVNLFMKRMKAHIAIFILAMIVVGLGSCMDKDQFPLYPVLTYKDFLKVQNENGVVEKGVLILEFTDGDGDIGLEDSDTLPPFHSEGGNYYNFIINLFEIKNGQYIPLQFPDTTFTYNSRIPMINLSGNSKAIKGELEYTFDLLIMQNFLNSDSIMIETYIVDRELNESNIVNSPGLSII